MGERIKTLAYFIISSKETLLLLRANIFDGTCYKLLLKAKFEEVLDLTGDDDFTEMNTLKTQIAVGSCWDYVRASDRAS